MRDFTPQDARRLVGRDDAVVLECGSNEGDDTCKFLEAFPTGIIHCFECEPRAISKFRRRCLGERAKLYEVALAESEGTRTFHRSGGKPPGRSWRGYEGPWDKSGSLLENDKHTEHSPWLDFSQTIEVQCTTLDKWAEKTIPDVPVVGFTWVDLQGSEHLMLQGGQKTFKKVQYAIFEIDRRPNYKGQARFSQIEELLPHFQFVEEYGGYNFLWKNKEIG